MVVKRDDIPSILQMMLRHVPPDKIKAFLRDMRKASDNTSYQATFERLQQEADRWLKQNKNR